MEICVILVVKDYIRKRGVKTINGFEQVENFVIDFVLFKVTCHTSMLQLDSTVFQHIYISN